MPGRTISERRLVTSVSVPVGTAMAAAVSVPWDLGNVILESVDVVIPDGHAGLTGLAFEYDGTRILPWGHATDWLVGDGETIATPVDFEVGHPLTVRAYNTDTFVHAFGLRALIRDLDPVAPPSGAQVVPVA